MIVGKVRRVIGRLFSRQQLDQDARRLGFNQRKLGLAQLAGQLSLLSEQQRNEYARSFHLNWRRLDGVQIAWVLPGLELRQPGQVFFQRGPSAGHRGRINRAALRHLGQCLRLGHQVLTRSEFGWQRNVAGRLLPLNVRDGLLKGDANFGGNGGL
jgi:hypothetical protein